MIMAKLSDFLPTSAKEVKARGWSELDVILFSGDAYVDHPSFGAAVIGRQLESYGYRVAIVPQPNWRDDLRDFKKLGKPRLFFGVTGGNMDSMVNHYTANLRLRSDDAYTPAGVAGFRPDRAVTVYCQCLRSLYPDTPIIVGGIEASLRRMAHYDYWSNSLKPSILADCGADLLVYGMGEKPIVEIAKAVHNGFNIKTLRKLRQVAFLADKKYVDSIEEEKILLHSYEECLKDKTKYAENFRRFEIESNKMEAATLIEPTGDKYLVINPQHPPMSESEIDSSFDLPYTRLPHPRYAGKAIPAYDMIKFSVNLHRGCFGGCSFCTISAHQGKFISSRSERSIMNEIEFITQMEEFRGNLSDLGGPSANMYKMGGKDKSFCEKCSRPSCIFPAICKNLEHNHNHLIALYDKVRKVNGIRHAYIGSGIRYDMFINEPEGENYLREVVKYHTSGRLKVAPEHTESVVLKLMRKPDFSLFEKLHERFHSLCRKENLKYQLVPYCISSHPGCTENDMKSLSRKMGRLNVFLEQIQDFTPTPMTLSSAIYYTGINPYTGEKVFVARDQEAKRRQKSYFFKKGK
ncbi:MAG: YgiQ family radical SAM protein [Rikenellaceae bacterium]|nr:YgiQ family radical SAM protein [Rikenellaceae bacterium]